MLPGRLTVECAQSQGSGVLSGVFTTVHWPDGARAHQVLAAGKHSLLWLATLSIMLDHLRRFLLQSAVRRWLDGLCGTILVGFGARLALARQ